MEKELEIKLKDGISIYGTLSTSEIKSDSLVIFIHGFICNANEHFIFNGAKFLAGKGFDTYRLNLYASGKNSRHFRDTKISLHGADITDVVKYFRNKYKKVYLVGHSYGGTSLLFVDQSIVDGFVFWDAAKIEQKDGAEDLKYNSDLDMYIMDCGVEILVGKPFVEELRIFPDCLELMKRIKKPVLLLTAGKAGNSKAGLKYYSVANEPKKLVNIETADHNFNNWADEDRLIKETFDWLKIMEDPVK